ncbi:hypothetical protein Y032_0573g167 [Ancylostoma ceylanicum]|uniref:Integrase catalytic domain-containing protein n=1 Tax=Ancylostoma ceylanicum TaxID=53326 RepID=A0A016WP10_9BILA|nr:hypothetical protein Y032_0573g167 [Ancylostoma ceylanicum]
MTTAAANKLGFHIPNTEMLNPTNFGGGYSLDTDESQDVVVAHDSRRDSVSPQSLAHGRQGSRDFSRDRNYRRRESSSHRSHPESRSGSSFSRAFHQLSDREPEYVSPSQESCRGHQPGSLHPGTDSSQHLVGINERVDYVDCFTHALSQFANGEQNSHPTLMLVKAKVRDVYNRLQELTILLDSASHFSSMTTAAANKLGFHIPNTEILNPTNFGGNPTTEVSGTFRVTFEDHCGNPLAVLLKIRNCLFNSIRSPQLSSQDTEFIQDFGFDLPFYHIAATVVPDVLIGIDYFWNIVTQEASVCLPSGLVFTHTRFGTVVSGASSFLQGISPTTSTGIYQSFEDDEDEEDDVSRLWNLERLGTTHSHGDEHTTVNTRVLEEFEGTSEVSEGYLYVRFPWKDPHPQPGDNKQLAHCRLIDQYHRLRQNPAVWSSYCAAIQQHLDSGFIEEVGEYVFDSPLVYYIPHQAVYKESSSTTTLSVAFDASSHMKGVSSLNDCLYEGPSLQPDITGVLIRARLRRYLLTAEVEKEFHQVRLQVSQRDVTRFLWLKNPSLPPSKDNLRIFRFRGIPFGVKSSSFMLVAAIHLLHRRLDLPLWREIERNTYTDKVVLGASSHREATGKYRSAKSTFSQMHMNLKEFLCSSHITCTTIDPQDYAKEPNTAKLLGFPWDRARDEFLIPIKISTVKVITKRSALRAFASTYDPLGLLTPYMTSAKLFIQDLRMKNYNWDDKLDEEDLEKWHTILTDLQHSLPPLRRCIVPKGTFSGSLCIFGDASQRLYASCAYLVGRSLNKVTCKLVMAKSHLNEAKTITIAELLATHNCVSLAQLLLKEMDINISQIYFFLSSQITLHWIHTSRPLEQFARNWVCPIQKILDQFQEQGIPAKFHYVSAEDNPANCAIRGMSTNANGEMWWNGPSFLKDHPDNWPNVGMDFSIPPVATSEQDQEFTEVSLALESSHSSVLPFTVTNSYNRLVRITTYILKFLRCKILSRVSAALQARLLQAIPALNNLSSDNIITAQDFQLAETFLIREHYRESEHALDQLHLDRLNIHRDEMGLIRCSGHLENAQSTSPVLLVPSHPLTRLVVLQVHTSLYHQGVYSTVAHLCTRFFIPFTYGNVGKFLSTCVICKEVTSCPQQYPDTSSLPAERVTISRPFQKVGLDYLGPIYCRDTGDINSKVWICLITCMATRALHLEVVNSDSTQDFLLAFRRFLVRRGTPELVYTNCATDDGKEALNKIFFEHGLWDKIQQFSTIYKITWKFVTCVSPWKEGFYERLVALFKSAFSKALGDRLLKQDQLHTVVVEIEKIINSRPITPYCEKSSLIQVLRPHDFTPSQFTLPLVADTFDIVFEGHRSTDWRKDTLDVLDQFWSTWRSGYLSVLAQRHQSRLCQSQYTHTHLRVNDVVNIGNGDVPRGQWKLGIVTEFIANKKGIVRSAKVRIPRGKFLTISIAHLYPLEISAHDDHNPQQRSTESSSSTTVQPLKKARRI